MSKLAIMEDQARRTEDVLGCKQVLQRSCFIVAARRYALVVQVEKELIEVDLDYR